MKFPDDRTFNELSVEECEERAKLTPKEKRSVAALVAAVKALPESLTIRTQERSEEKEPQLLISKRITKGSTYIVAGVKKKSIVF